MSIEQIVNLVAWWPRLLVMLSALLKQQQPRCKHFVTFIFWRPSWLGKVKEYTELRCRLHAPLLGDRTSLWRTCRICEHNQAAAVTSRRVPIRTDSSKVPSV